MGDLEIALKRQREQHAHPPLVGCPCPLSSAFSPAAAAKIRTQTHKSAPLARSLARSNTKTHAPERHESEGGREGERESASQAAQPDRRRRCFLRPGGQQQVFVASLAWPAFPVKWLQHPLLPAQTSGIFASTSPFPPPPRTTTHLSRRACSIRIRSHHQGALTQQGPSIRIAPHPIAPTRTTAPTQS